MLFELGCVILCVLQDQEELELLCIWEGMCRPTLADFQEPQAQEQYLTSEGKPWGQSSLCDWWKALHARSKAPWPFITMHQIRHVMVEEVMANPGQVDTGAAAMLMGNSTKVWKSHYDKGAGGRMLATGHADVVTFRAAHLQEKPGKKGMPLCSSQGSK